MAAVPAPIAAVQALTAVAAQIRAAISFTVRKVTFSPHQRMISQAQPSDSSTLAVTKPRLLKSGRPIRKLAALPATKSAAQMAGHRRRGLSKSAASPMPPAGQTETRTRPASGKKKAIRQAAK